LQITDAISKILTQYCDELKEFDCGQGINLRIRSSKTSYTFKENADVETISWLKCLNEIQEHLSGERESVVRRNRKR